MSSKRIEIFKKASNSLKISSKCHAFSKKASQQLRHCHIGQSTPGPAWLGTFGFVGRFDVNNKKHLEEIWVTAFIIIFFYNFFELFKRFTIFVG
jgi:hypothetical protein